MNKFTPNPGPGYILLADSNIISKDDEWIVPSYSKWLPVGAGEVGKTVKEARSVSYFHTSLFYRTKDPTATLCGCGNHTIDKDGDPYEQHRLWAEDAIGE